MSWLLHRSMSMKGIEENEADTELSMGTPTTGAVSLNSKLDTDVCMYVYVYVCMYARTYVRIDISSILRGLRKFLIFLHF
jgi:hypothetical protein